ncbi:MAG TPA: hypothetical protein VFQ92_18380 [Blastocatellia bacterium]|nr:hypothetical protein [Blastocatellia bacterium]
MELTAAHWVYAAFVVMVVITMAKRYDALVPCIAGVFTLGWIMTGSPLGAILTVFKSTVVAMRELLDIIVVISLIVGLATMLRNIGAERLMVAPAAKLMKSPEIAFWVIGVVMLVSSYFLWPSPATALVGVVLVPVAASVRLPAITAAMAMNIFGHGIALSTDYVIQGAPSISAKAANLPVEAVMRSGIPLIATMSVVTVAAAFFIARRDIARARDESDMEMPTASEPAVISVAATTSGDGPITMQQELVSTAVEDPPQAGRVARVAAAVVPLTYLGTVILLVAFQVRGGDATAVIGGVTLLLLTLFVLLAHGGEGFNIISDHLIKGFGFGIRIFAPVVIIASFFYLGSPEIARQVFGDGSRGLLFDLAEALSRVVPLNRISVGLMQTTVGMVVGLDGSGFSGLPLMGSLAGAFAGVAALDTGTIAALGQIATIWVGGGCIIPWGVVAVAAICRVSPRELAAKNLVPVLLGLATTTVMAILLM